MNIFRLKNFISHVGFLRKHQNVVFQPRFQFSEEALEKFTDIFQRKEAEEQNKKYSSGNFSLNCNLSKRKQ